MKTTYKLIGDIWDKASLPGESPLFCCGKDIPPDVSEPTNLFDMQGKHRSIALTKVLAATSQHDLDSIFEPAKDCDELVIVLDYWPTIKSTVIEAFLRLRISQVYGYASEVLPNAVVSISWPADSRVKAVA